MSSEAGIATDPDSENPLEDMDLSQLVLEEAPKDLRDFLNKQAPELVKKAEAFRDALETKSKPYIEKIALLVVDEVGEEEDRQRVKDDIQNKWNIHVASVYKSLPKTLKDGNKFEKIGATLSFADDIMEGLDDFSYSMREAYPKWALLDKSIRAQEVSQMLGLYGAVQATVKGLSIVGKSLTKYGKGSNKWVAAIEAIVEVGMSVIKKIKRAIGAGATKSVKALYEGMGGEHTKGLENLTSALEIVSDWNKADAAQRAKLFQKNASKLSPELSKSLGAAMKGADPQKVKAIYEIVENSKGSNAELMVAANLAALDSGLDKDKRGLLASLFKEKDIVSGIKQLPAKTISDLTEALCAKLGQKGFNDTKGALSQSVRDVLKDLEKVKISQEGVVEDFFKEEAEALKTAQKKDKGPQARGQNVDDSKGSAKPSRDANLTRIDRKKLRAKKPRTKKQVVRAMKERVLRDKAKGIIERKFRIKPALGASLSASPI